MHDDLALAAAEKVVTLGGPSLTPAEQEAWDALDENERQPLRALARKRLEEQLPSSVKPRGVDHGRTAWTSQIRRPDPDVPHLIVGAELAAARITGNPVPLR